MTQIETKLVGEGIDVDAVIADIVSNLDPVFFDNEELKTLCVSAEETPSDGEYGLLDILHKDIINVYVGREGVLSACQLITVTNETTGTELDTEPYYYFFGNRMICDPTDSPVFKFRTVDRSNIADELRADLINLIYFAWVQDNTNSFNALSRLTTTRINHEAERKNQVPNQRIIAGELTPWQL